jgi:hypothetical protein
MHKVFGFAPLALILAAACDSPVAPRTAPVPGGPAMVIGDPPPTVGDDCTVANPCDIDVLPPGGVSPNGIIVANTSTAECAGTLPDADQDGFNDDCEYRLAAAFAPELRFTAGDGSPSRETYWAVTYKPGFWPSSTVTIAYLLGYHRDGGHPLVAGATAHVGDSEFIFVELRSTGGAFWDGHRAYTSAHWRVGFPGVDRSETHEYNDLQYAYWAGGPARFYVAKNKHASYNSAAKCNWNGDVCGPSHFSETVQVLPGRNVGSSHHRLVDCVGSVQPALYPGTECFWTPIKFKGWNVVNVFPDAGSYRDVLNFWESRAASM